MTPAGGPTIHAAWVELCIAGFVAALLTRMWLAWVQGAERAAPAIGAASSGREAVLAETCDASESGWSRVARASLAGVQATFEGGYRDGALPLPRPELVRVYEEEKARLGRGLGVGLAGSLAMIVPAIVMARTGELTGVAAFVGVVATLVAWRNYAAASRSRAAIETVWRGLDALARLDPPPPPRVVDPSAFPIRLRSAGCFGLLLLLPTVVVVLVCFVDATQIVKTSDVPVHLFSPVFFSPLVLMTVMALTKKRIELDVRRGELTLTSRLLGVPTTRIRIPLEIVRGAVVRRTAGPRASEKLVIELTAPGAETELDGGGLLMPVADRLNRIFKRESAS